MGPRDVLKMFYNVPSPFPRHRTDVNAVCAYGDKLGELVMISRIPMKAKAEGKSVYTFVNPDNKFVDFFRKWTHCHMEPPPDAIRSSCQAVVEGHNCGPGNILQQVYAAVGLGVDVKPRGFLGIPSRPKRNKVGIHLDGVTAGTMLGYPRVRTIYPENIAVIQKFILANQQYEWVQFGLGSPLEGVTSFLGKSIDDSIHEVSTCEFMVCLNSAFMTIAAALDVKTIVIINNPRVEACFFPVMTNMVPPCVPPYDIYDSFWLYPQNVHLHQDGENPLVPRFSADSLARALDGRVYPYFRDDYLDMIFEYS